MTQSTLSAHLLERLSTDIAAAPRQVVAAVELLDGGATVPFIARYRKEATGGLSDDQLRLLEERLIYLRELESRRETILSQLELQGKLTDELREDISRADTKQALEDIYAPFKSKRRTRAMIAREAGLESLADSSRRCTRHSCRAVQSGCDAARSTSSVSRSKWRPCFSCEHRSVERRSRKISRLL